MPFRPGTNLGAYLAKLALCALWVALVACGHLPRFDYVTPTEQVVHGRAMRVWVVESGPQLYDAKASVRDPGTGDGRLPQGYYLQAARAALGETCKGDLALVDTFRIGEPGTLIVRLRCQ